MKEIFDGSEFKKTNQNEKKHISLYLITSLLWQGSGFPVDVCRKQRSRDVGNLQ